MRWLTKIPLLLICILFGATSTYFAVKNIALGYVIKNGNYVRFDSEPASYVLGLLPLVVGALIGIGFPVALLFAENRYRKKLQATANETGKAQGMSPLAEAAGDFNWRMTNGVLGAIIWLFIIQWWSGFVLLAVHIAIIILGGAWYAHKWRKATRNGNT